ncbi:hypothetical protein [Streptosporangium sp. KLBMP 9127]|nr:hypothetical protein [Streptosporangium sp. KLBMP 9127]
MSAPTGSGNLVLGPGRGAEWVSAHGAHLMDYARHHLDPGQAVTSVGSALVTCLTRDVQVETVTPRARLLAVLRNDCLGRHGPDYEPGAGPGMPDARLLGRAWRLADPLGTEALRLMYRHELGADDLAHVLALPVQEASRLTTRTQDLIETLVSGLDSLTHGRPTCPALSPLAHPVFLGPQAPERFGEDRMALLTHMAECHDCRRPINIRFTVPQMISHPPIEPLPAETRRRLLDVLPEPADPASIPTAGITLPGRTQDTPLYDALRSQARARAEPAPLLGAPVTHLVEPEARPEEFTQPQRVRHAEPRTRRLDAVRQVRPATVKLAIVVVAGLFGLLAGVNFLGPATIEEAAPQAADPDTLTGRLSIPQAVSLDEFGQGTITLSISGAPLEWRITAPGLEVTPAGGTLEQGTTRVITVRALRVRQWCGAPAPTSAPLTLHGPHDSITTTVRWSTC